MSDARIVTDSSADLSPQVARELGIEVVPLGIRLGSGVMVEGRDLHPLRFHGRVAREGLTATVVAPTPGQFGDAYARLARETSNILSIHLSSRLSGTVQAATRGRLRLLGRCHVSVIDSQAISRGLGILVTEAAKAAQNGVAASEIVRLVRGMIPRTYLAFYVQDPDHLRRHGFLRQSPGALFDVSARPILTMEEGEITRVRRLRGRGTALERLFEFVAEFRRLKELSVLHSGLVPEVEEFRARLAESLPSEILKEHIYGPALGAYIGPRALGVVAFEEQAGYTLLRPTR